jgi:transcriptional regulator with GAF, ATPase, and Fis domain
MSAKLRDFVRSYREGFHAYLRDRDERALTRAYDLGRSAVAQELTVLDLASAHQEVLLDSLQSDPSSTSHEDVIRAAGDFFIEGVSAFEVVTRALQEARETVRIERRQATILRHLSTFLADASLALDASGSLDELAQLVAEHARELTSAERGAVHLILGDDTPSIEAFATDQRDPSLESQLNELSALYRALEPPTGALRMTNSDLDRHRRAGALTDPEDTSIWKPRGWLVAALTALDGHHLGLIQVLDKQTGDFTELDEATLVQLAQMASAAVERAQRYRRMQA